MVNTDDFIKRLEVILDYYSLNASTFADKIGVQRSSMSHLLSGRNKPSLDFILKINAFFPEIDLYWLLNGKGVFLKKSEIDQKSNSDPDSDPMVLNLDTPTPIDLFSQIPEPSKPEIDFPKSKIFETLGKIENSDEIEKIVFFYKNGSFKMYSSN